MRVARPATVSLASRANSAAAGRVSRISSSVSGVASPFPDLWHPSLDRLLHGPPPLTPPSGCGQRSRENQTPLPEDLGETPHPSLMWLDEREPATEGAERIGAQAARPVGVGVADLHSQAVGRHLDVHVDRAAGVQHGVGRELGREERRDRHEVVADERFERRHDEVAGRRGAHRLGRERAGHARLDLRVGCGLHGPSDALRCSKGFDTRPLERTNRTSVARRSAGFADHPPSGRRRSAAPGRRGGASDPPRSTRRTPPPRRARARPSGCP